MHSTKFHRVKAEVVSQPAHFTRAVTYKKEKKTVRLQQGRRKNFPDFSRLFQSHDYTFPEVLTTKYIMTFIYQGSFHINYYSCD